MKRLKLTLSLYSIIILAASVTTYAQTGTITVNYTDPGGCGENATGSLTLNGGYEKIVRWEHGEYIPGQTIFWDGFIITQDMTIPYSVSTSTAFRVKIDNITYSSVVIIEVDSDAPAVGGSISPAAVSYCGVGSGTLTLSGHEGSIARWEKYTGDSWTSVGNAGQSSFTYSNQPQSTEYRVVVQNGPCTAYSSVASVTINPVPDGGFITGGGLYCNSAAIVFLDLAAYYGDIEKWEMSIDDGANWTDIENTSSSLTVHSITQTTRFRAAVTTSNCGQSYSSQAIVEIHPSPVAGNLVSSIGASACTGFQTEIAVTSNTGSPRYWVSSNGGTSWDIYEEADLGNSFTLDLSTQGNWIIETHPYDGVCGINMDSGSQLSISVSDLVNPQVEGETTVFPGRPYTYNASNLQSGTNYYWDVSNGEIVSGQNTSTAQIKFQQGPGTVLVSTTHSNCNDTGTGSLDVYSRVNYVKEETVKIGSQTMESQLSLLSVEEKNVTISYLDGFGRQIQQSAWQATPGKKDLVSAIAYDAFGRQAVNYLPYANDAGDGKYNIDPVEKGKDDPTYSGSPQYQFYQNGGLVATDTRPYAETIFEASPLNRVLKQGAPGAAWQPDSDPMSLADKTVKMRYEFNQQNEVILFDYNEETGQLDAGGIGALNYYDPNELYANKTYDEHSNEVVELTDKEGRTVLKKVQYAEEGGVKLYAETYYIYDDFGNLVVVLPPEGTAYIKNLLAQE